MKLKTDISTEFIPLMHKSINADETKKWAEAALQLQPNMVNTADIKTPFS